jgi:hypothetical protein
VWVQIHGMLRGMARLIFEGYGFRIIEVVRQLKKARGQIRVRHGVPGIQPRHLDAPKKSR